MIALAQSAIFPIATAVAIGSIATTIIPQRARIAAILRLGPAGSVIA